MLGMITIISHCLLPLVAGGLAALAARVSEARAIMRSQSAPLMRALAPPRRVEEIACRLDPE
jgi:hypothetical protein